MSVPISATSDRAVVSLRPGMVERSADRRAHGAQRVANPHIDRGDGTLQAINLQQMQLDHKAVMLGDAPMQCLAEVGAAGFQAPAREVGQPVGIGLAGDDRGEDRPAAHPHNVGQHAGQLDIGVLQRLLHTLDVSGDFPSELPPRSREIAERLDRARAG